ncbi:MAG: 5'-nucleotidase [Acidobacteria bacterium]|nr:5'-nucleotidase [Acidobacteriota bacterium]
MTADLNDKTWMVCGISLLWDPEALNEICPPDSVRSLREFLRLHQAEWPEDALHLINNRTLVVAGLEAAMDTLNPQEAVEWLEQIVYPAVRDFQENVADGGGEAALIFWFADANRIWHRAADNTHHWYCSGEYHQHSIPIGRCIWNGAEPSVRRTINVGSDKKKRNIGLFLRRIS